MKRAVAIYDTTLRDGSQREGISFSVADKLHITRLLDELGIAYIEGGWPGSNPKDVAYFADHGFWFDATKGRGPGRRREYSRAG